jgi:RNA polymerase sigma-70 factor (ECF subfamily)
MDRNRVAEEAGFEPYMDGLRAAAQRLTMSDPEADDLVQDCLAAAVRGAGGVRKRGVLGAWLHQILRRRWYDLLRRRALERRHLAEGRRAAPAVAAEPPGNEIVRLALAALEPDARLVLELRFFQARTSVDIARQLQKPVGTVRSQLFYALRKFEAEFKRLCPKENA